MLALPTAEVPYHPFVEEELIPIVEEELLLYVTAFPEGETKETSRSFKIFKETVTLLL